jgi:hypothetical protein
MYCSVVESMASVAAYAWISANGGGSLVGVNNQHRLPNQSWVFTDDG